MPLFIPTSDDIYRTQSFRIQNSIYNMNTYYNSIFDRWIMDLLDADNIEIATGMTMGPSINLLEYDVTLTNEIGEFRIATKTQTSLEGGDDALGNTLQLLYYSPGEFEEENPDFGESQVNGLPVYFDDIFSVP